MCSSIELAGLGNQLLALEALKKKLQSEGLFDESRKRNIPKFPEAIGIIVGKGSAAEADLLKNLNRRWPISELYFFPLPCPRQGSAEGSPAGPSSWL
jgi:exodeoxyribonuclease VII large subunit